VRKTSGLDGEASVASEDFVSADSDKGSAFGPSGAEGLDLRAAMPEGLRKRSLYRRKTLYFDGQTAWLTRNTAIGLATMKTRAFCNIKLMFGHRFQHDCE
jgi:hypothetical protein